MTLSRNCMINMKYSMMNENTAFRLRYPIAILIAIIISVILKNNKSINNRFIAHVLVPIVTFLGVMFIIDISVRSTLSQNRLKQAQVKCDAISLKPNKYILDAQKDSAILQRNYVDNISREPVENFESGVENVESNIGNIAEYVRHDENKVPGVSNLIQDAEYSNNIPPNDGDSNTSDIDKYANLNTNIVNDTKNSYTQSIDTMCGGKDCCLLGNKCGTPCSGQSNTCNVVTPVPGPQWQVQSASITQNRMTNGIYTSSKCPLT